MSQVFTLQMIYIAGRWGISSSVYTSRRQSRPNRLVVLVSGVQQSTTAGSLCRRYGRRSLDATTNVQSRSQSCRTIQLGFPKSAAIPNRIRGRSRLRPLKTKQQTE